MMRWSWREPWHIPFHGCCFLNGVLQSVLAAVILTGLSIALIKYSASLQQDKTIGSDGAGMEQFYKRNDK